MAGINVNGIGRNPYADSYLISAKNRSNTTSKDTFVNAVKKVEESKNSADTSNVMYPGDVTIDYPPRINYAVNNSVVSEKSKDEMSLDEYKQWVMNQISQFPVSGWVRSTFSSGSIVIKEEAFERMKNDPEYENYVLNRVRSAYSVKGLSVGSNNVSFDVIGASPEEWYGYAGPVGKSGLETANDGETWWEKRHKRLEEFIEEQIEKNQKEHLIKRKQMEDVYRSRTYESKQRLSNLLNNSNANSDNVNIQSLVSTAASSYEKSIEMVSHDKIWIITWL